MRPGWFKFPDNLISDQRICRIGQAQAITALIAAYSHAEKEESDGFVPRGVPVGVSSEVVVAGLVLSGLFEEVPGGLQIVGFLEINATHERREAERAATLKRVQEFRARREEKEANTVKNTVSNGVNNASGMRDEVLGTRNEDLPPSAAPASPEKMPQKASKPPADSSRVWEHYKTRFQAKSPDAAKPTTRTHFFVQLAELLKQHPVEEIIRRIDHYFDSPPWTLREGARDFGRFLKCFDQLALPARAAGVGSGTNGRLTPREVLEQGPRLSAMAKPALDAFFGPDTGPDTRPRLEEENGR